MPDVRRRAHAVLLPSADVTSRRLGALLCMPASTAATGHVIQRVGKDILLVELQLFCLLPALCSLCSRFSHQSVSRLIES